MLGFTHLPSLGKETCRMTQEQGLRSDHPLGAPRARLACPRWIS